MAIPHFPRRRRLWTVMIVVAACAVGLGADRSPVDRLIEQLRAGDARARSQAALRIGLLGPRAAFAVGALDSALDDPDPHVRANAMYSLVRLGSRSPRLLPILAQEIEATPEPLRVTMSTRNGVTGAFAAPEGWTLSDGGLRYNDPIDALKQIRPDATAFVPLLGKALKSPRDRESEVKVVQAGLPRFPGDCLRTREDCVRAAALEALFAVAAWSDPSSPEPTGALLAVLADERFDRHSEFREALGEFRDRQRAADILAKLDRAAQERAVEQLARDLRNLGSPRSYEAALLLPRLGGGTATAVSILLDFLRDGDDIRRRIAMILLEPIAGPAEFPAVWRAITAPGADRQVKVRDRMNWWEALQRGPGCIAFSPEIGRGDTSLIAFGVRTLKAMGVSIQRRSIRELLDMLREPDGDPDRTRCAIIALGDFGPSAAEAVPVLADIIRAGEEADRRASRSFAAWDSPGALATATLGRIGAEGNPEALAILAGLIETPGWTVGPHAASELARLGPKAKPAVPALVKALKDPRPALQSAARQALASIGGP
jgi:HEAT repeat protein